MATSKSQFYIDNKVYMWLSTGVVTLTLVTCQSPTSDVKTNEGVTVSAPIAETSTEEFATQTPFSTAAVVAEKATEIPVPTKLVEIENNPVEEVAKATATVESINEAITVVEIVRISVSSDGSEVTDNSPMRPNNLPMDISADGRFAVFHSRATGLDAADKNDLSDVFVHDLETGSTERVSLSIETDDARGESHSPAISNDGHRIAFVSWGLSIGGVQEYGIYLADRSERSLRFVASGFNPDISGDGHTIVFVSDSALSENDTNEYSDIYAYHMASDTITLISQSSVGDASDGTSNFPAISEDGSRIAFISMATNLAGDENGSESDVFIYDASEGKVTRLAGTERAELVMLSDNGQWVVFPRGANSVAKSVNSPDNTKAIPGIALSISADGNHIVYIKPPMGLYLYDMQPNTSIPLSTSLEGEVVSGYHAAISSSGNAVVFESSHHNLVLNDTNNTYDIFVAKLNSPRD